MTIPSRLGKALRFSGALALVFGTLSATAARADGLLDKAKAEGLAVAFYNYNPNSFFNDKGELVGTDPDTLNAVLAAMDAKIASTQDTEWGNLIPGLKAGRFDAVAAGMYITPERCEEVAFSEPIFGVTNAIAMPKGNPKEIEKIEDIAAKGLTVAVIAGSGHVGYAALAGIPADKVLQIPDTASAIAAVRAGRADAFFVDAGGIKALISSVPEQDFEMTKPFSEINGHIAMPHGAIAFRPEDADFVAVFNKYLEQRVKSPEHVNMLETYGLSADDLPRYTAAELCAAN